MLDCLGRYGNIDGQLASIVCAMDMRSLGLRISGRPKWEVDLGTSYFPRYLPFAGSIHGGLLPREWQGRESAHAHYLLYSCVAEGSVAMCLTRLGIHGAEQDGVESGHGAISKPSSGMVCPSHHSSSLHLLYFNAMSLERFEVVGEVYEAKIAVQRRCDGV